MLIRMTASKMGSPDPAGLFTMLFKAGEKYDVPDALALVFLRERWAEEDKELVLETKDEAPPKEGGGDVAGKSGRRKK